MSPIDFGGGMIFPNSYDRDPPEPPEPAHPDGCPECGCAVHEEGDRYEWAAWCENPACAWLEACSHPEL